MEGRDAVPLSQWGRCTTIRIFPTMRFYPIYAPTDNLVDAVLGAAPNQSPATLGLSAMKLIEGACESVRTGGNVILELV